MHAKHVVVSSVVLMLTAAWAGCSGSTATTPSDAGSPDASADTAPPRDGGSDTATGNDAAPPDAGASDAPNGFDGALVCGSAPCTGSDVCCVTQNADGGFVESCMASCGDGGTVGCSGPAQCNSAAPFCCGHVKTAPGAGFSCPVESISSSCEATCTTALSACSDAGASETVRLCQTKADCASDPTYNACCSFPQSGNSQAFCVPAQLAQFGGGTCAP